MLLEHPDCNFTCNLSNTSGPFLPTRVRVKREYSMTKRDLPAGTKLADALFLQRDFRQYIGYRRWSRADDVFPVERVRTLISPFRLVDLLGFSRFLGLIRRPTGFARDQSLFRRFFIVSSRRCRSLLDSTRFAGRWLRFPCGRRIIPWFLRRLRPNFGKSTQRIL